MVIKMKQKLANFSISSLSISSRVAYGLLLYPYQTVLELVRHSIFLPIVLVPFVSFVMIKLAWFLLINPLFGPGPNWLLSLLANWLVLFLGLWQLLLIYLTIRFWQAIHSA